MSSFKKALIWTAIPIVVLSVISAAGRMPTGGGLDWDPLLALWFVAAGLLGLVILAAIGFAVARKRQIAAGILAGIGIGSVSLGVTCFANMSVG